MSQKPDDHGGPDEAARNGIPRTVSKSAFGCLSWTLCFVISPPRSASPSGSLRGRGRPLRWRADRGLRDAQFRSVEGRSGRHPETRRPVPKRENCWGLRGRTVALPRVECGSDVVEVRCSSSDITRSGVVLPDILSAVRPDFGHNTHNDQIKRASAELRPRGAAFGLAAGYFLYEGRWGKPQAWSDASGITGYPIGSAFRRRFVLGRMWRRARSKPTTIRSGSLCDHQADPSRDTTASLCSLNLQLTKMEDQERLVKYVQRQSCPSRVDFWD